MVYFVSVRLRNIKHYTKNKVVRTKNKSHVKECVPISQNEEIHNSYREAIFHNLLVHYKCLNFCGIRFTWLGIHKLYRVTLVACNTYIAEPLPRLLIMTSILMCISVVYFFAKPYRDEKANKAAMLSYVANICIAIVNLCKTMLVTFDCKTNCSLVAATLPCMKHFETVMLRWAAIAAKGVWVLYAGLQKCFTKTKGN